MRLAFAVYLFAASVAVGGAPQLQIQAQPGLESTAARISALGESDFSRELELAGLDGFGAPIQVVVAREGSRLAKVAPRWASAFTVPERSLIVIFPHRTPAYPDRNLEAALRHELMHVLVYRAAHGRHVPRWFNEGLATVAGRQWGLEDRARHALALIGKGPRTVSELDQAFGGNAASAARAYALSAALTRSLIRRHGTDMPSRILALLATGVPFRAALTATLSAKAVLPTDGRAATMIKSLR